MKQKLWVAFAGICLLALAVFGAYRIDMRHMANNEPVVFGTWGRDDCPSAETPRGEADGEGLPAADENGGVSALYLRVLNDLWEKDSGLNGGIDYVSVDLAAAPVKLTAEECTRIAEIFAAAHGVEGLTLTADELDEQGYLTEQPLEGTGQAWQCWENGVLFRIAEDSNGQPGDAQTLCFTADKWRSPLGAYCFVGCTATCGTDGTWGEYTVGGEMIS